ncbi:MAG TPA: hypothetical protein PLF22_00750 [Pseudomonadales bacterium]|nr:hypothetical protein [Pseudomonadales bacterium]
MNAMQIVCFVVFLLGVVTGLGQLWFSIWTDETFAKLLITEFAVLGVFLVLSFLIRESEEVDAQDKKL